MELDKYRMYSVNVNNSIELTKNQILNEIEQMKQIYDYDEILNFIELHYGKLNDWLDKKLNDEMYIGILKKDNCIELAVINENGIVFGRRWKLISDESANN